mmetsp:Transcript_94570/g.216328  ORF Transcript_94570/g.216328 Transcript_94570/m.216328 type:complete len:372 (+) Transcript_94570:410-1525(+)
MGQDGGAAHRPKAAPQQPPQPLAQAVPQAVPQPAVSAEGPALTLLEHEVQMLESEPVPLPQPPQGPANGGLLPAPVKFNVGDIVQAVTQIFCRGAVAVDAGGRGTVTKTYPEDTKCQVHFQNRQDGGNKPMIVQCEQLRIDASGPPQPAPGQLLLPPPPMMPIQPTMPQPLLQQQQFQPALQQPLQPWNFSPQPQIFPQQPPAQPPWALQSPPPPTPTMPHPGFPPPGFQNFPGGPNPMPFSGPGQVFTGGPTGPSFTPAPARLSGERLEKLLAANLGGGGGTGFSGGTHPGPPPTMPRMVPPPAAAQMQPNPAKVQQPPPGPKAPALGALPTPAGPPAGEKPAAIPAKKKDEPLTDDDVMDAYHKLLEEI